MRRAPGEGSIFRRPDGSWQGYVTYQSRRIYRRGATRREVTAKLQAALEEAARAQAQLVAGETFEQYAARWLAQQAAPRVTPGSAYAYKLRLRMVARHIGRRLLSKLTHRDVIEAYGRLVAEGKAQTTLYNIHALLGALFKYAAAEGVIPRDPMALVAVPRVEKKEQPRLSPKQMGILLDSYQRATDGSIWVVMLAGGLRWSEAAALSWADLDHDAELVHVSHHVVRRTPDGKRRRGQKSGNGEMVVPLTKTGRRYDIGLAPWGWEALAYQRTLADEAGDDQAALIWHRPGRPDTPVPYGTMRWRWRKFCGEYGLPSDLFHPHTLRHTAGHVLYALTGDIKLVSDQLGHASIQTTANVYARGRVDQRTREGLAAFGALAAPGTDRDKEGVTDAPVPEGVRGGVRRLATR